MPSNTELAPLYLIDSYALIYRSYFAFMSRPLRNGSGENISALFGYAKALAGLINAENVQRGILVAAVFDSRVPTFRHELYPAYKATRQKAPDDLHAQVPKVEAFLSALGIALLRSDGYEADDIIAVLAGRCREEGRECFILSSDKDLLQLVGDGIYELRPSKTGTDGACERIGPEEVKSIWGVGPEKILDLLSLTGDASDNVPGVKGIGEKTAVKLLARYGSLDEIYKNIASVEGAIGKKLAEGRESAYLSRDLITLSLKALDPVPNIDVFSTDGLNRSAGARFLINEGIPSVAKSLESTVTGSEVSTYGDTNGGGMTRAVVPPELLGSGVYHVVTDKAELAEFFAKALSRGFMAMDFETDSLNAWKARPAGLSFAVTPKEAIYVPVAAHEGIGTFINGEIVRDMLSPLLSDENFTIIAHNAKYDYEVSRGWGIARWKAKIFDTMVAAWLCDSERAGYSLDSLSFAYLAYTAVSYKDVVPKDKTFIDISLEAACRYSAEDADLCLRLHSLLSVRLKETGVDTLFSDIEMPLVPILAEMEGAGIRIEGDALRSYGTELAAQLEEIEKETWRVVGHDFNIASPKQLQEVLFVERKLTPTKKTKTGWSTDVAVLEELAREDRVPELILRHRSLAKLKSTYVDTLPGLTCEKGRIHTTFMQTGTATGRLSGRDPNLQNIPIREEAGRRIREAFVAEPGSVLISADYSQIELVVLAHLSGDKNLIAAFREGKDVHTRTASMIFGVNEDAVDASQRRVAKTINFGVMYGMSAFRLSGELKIGRRAAADFIDAYFKTYSGVRAFIDDLIRKTEKQGYVSTLFGRRRPVAAINSSNKTEKAAAERIAVNTPIQGSAADIVKKAMIDADRAVNDSADCRSARLLLQVHDELILECVENEADAASALLRNVMENAVSLAVPLRVSVECGRRWGDFH